MNMLGKVVSVFVDIYYPHVYCLEGYNFWCFILQGLSSVRGYDCSMVSFIVFYVGCCTFARIAAFDFKVKGLTSEEES